MEHPDGVEYRYQQYLGNNSERMEGSQYQNYRDTCYWDYRIDTVGICCQIKLTE
jgi:hypothetical protein